MAQKKNPNYKNNHNVSWLTTAEVYNNSKLKVDKFQLVFGFQRGGTSFVAEMKIFIVAIKRTMDCNFSLDLRGA